MRLHKPVHHTQQPHLNSGIPLPSYAGGGAVDGADGFSNSVAPIGGSESVGGGGGSTSLGTIQSMMGSSSDPMPSGGAGSSGGGASAGSDTPNFNMATPPANQDQHAPVQTSGVSSGAQGGGTTTPAPANNAYQGFDTNRFNSIMANMRSAVGSSLGVNQNNSAGTAPTVAPTGVMSTNSGHPHPQGGWRNQPGHGGYTRNQMAKAQAQYYANSQGDPAIGSGGFAEGGVVGDDNSVNPLNRILNMAKDKIPSIKKPPEAIPTYGPTKEQAGPQRNSENDSDDRQSFAEGGPVQEEGASSNDNATGEVDPSTLLGGSPQASTSADNGALPDPGKTLGGPAPDAGSQTVAGLVQGAQKSYQTIQQALQKAWSASKGTGQASSASTALNQPGAQAPGGGGGGFAGSTTASGIPSPANIQAQGPSGQAQLPPLPQATGAGNPINPGNYPVNTTNVSGTPMGGQMGAASAQSPGRMAQPPVQNPQDPNEGAVSG